LVHGVRVYEGHHWTAFAHGLVIKCSVDVVGHAFACSRVRRCAGMASAVPNVIVLALYGLASIQIGLCGCGTTDQASGYRSFFDEVRHGFGLDLVARPRQTDADLRQHHAGRLGKHNDTVREVDRLVDIVGDQNDGDVETVSDLRHQVFQVGTGLRVD